MEEQAPGHHHSLKPERFALSDISSALSEGWRVFLVIPGPSVIYALPFALIGLIILSTIGVMGISPLVLPFAGGFMLIGPPLLTGYFKLLNMESRGERPGAFDAFSSFSQAPAALWVIAVFCTFLFLVWITDAAVLYSMMIGGAELPYVFPGLINLQNKQVIPFELWGSLMGALLAFIIFAISAFSVPLIHSRRGNLVQAIHASVRAVFHNFFMAIVWGMLLTGLTVVSIILLPFFLVVLPVLAYASHHLYLKVFPPTLVENN